MPNVWESSIWLYLGDTIMVAAALYGAAAAIGAAIRHSRGFLILDVTDKMLHRFAYFMVIWMASALILFKFIVLQGAPDFTKNVLTGNHGSVQFSTAGEAVAGVLTLFGLFKWAKWSARHLRLTQKP